MVYFYIIYTLVWKRKLLHFWLELHNNLPMMKEEALILLAFSQTGLSSSVFPVEKKKKYLYLYRRKIITVKHKGFSSIV